MSEKIVILAGDEIEMADETGTGFAGEQHSKDKALDKLERAWPELMRRMRRIVEQDAEDTAGGFVVDTVEFGVAVETGFDFVISGTASADAKITFKRKS